MYNVVSWVFNRNNKRLSMKKREGETLITKEDIDHVAFLSRLELTEKERETYVRQLNAILEKIQPLKLLDTENVQPTAHILPVKNVFREDSVGQHMSLDNAMANSREHDENYFKVPKII